MKKRHTFYLMIASMFIRLFWLAVFEPHGAKKAVAKTQQMGELAKLASETIPYVVYPSIIILVFIIVFSIMKKKTAYLASSIFGFVHLLLISILLIMQISPGMGFLVVVPSSLGMMVFSYICYKENYR
ncbi:MAG: hypothetical protein K8S13_21430 [Desulfobacula sp.]|uniref:hypothetical protein n=1 Tax=Desulfobacula sp. TaxID=2593537 RepID=UPI0025C084FD|nr:hypothetical protein [Desulfobacula sp.]MCD4722396.1 hypothetical protein [Desulfobacula sp.]